MATDAEIRAQGINFLSPQRYLQNPYQLSVEEETAPVSGGITNTNAFTNSRGGGSGGNAFGYGTAIKPGDPYTLFGNEPITSNITFKQKDGTMYSDPTDYRGQSGYYGSPNFQGGLPGDIQSTGPGRHFEYDNTGAFYKDYSLTPRKEIPGFLRAGAAFVPFGNFALNQIEKKMNPEGPFTKDDNPYGGNYGIGGLSDAQKEAYNNLAGQGMLFEGPGGMKTLTGKNFTGKGYMEGQREIYDDMTEKGYGIDEDGTVTFNGKPLKSTQKNLSNRFKESSALFKGEKEKENMANLAAAESRRESARQYDSAVHGPNNYGLGADGKQSYDSGQGFGTNATSGGPVSNKTGRGRTDYMKGGRAGYFFGGRARLQGGGMSQGNEKNQTQSANMGGGTSGDFSTAEQTMNHNRAMGDNPREKPSIIKNIIDTGSELNYLNNLKNLNVPGIVLGFGVNRFRDFIGNKKTKEEEDKLSALPNNNYFAEVQQKDLDASKMRGFKKQNYNSYLEQMDMLNGGSKVTPYEFKGLQDGTITTTGTFTAANGGRAMFKNGGLASIL